MKTHYSAIFLHGMLASAAPAALTETQWIWPPAGLSNWFAAASWSAGVPTAESTAFFAPQGSTPAITLSGGDVISGRLTLTRGELRFSGGSTTPITLFDENAFAASLSIGTLVGEIATMKFTGSVPLTAPSIDIALANNCTATLDVSGYAPPIEIAHALRIGVVGTGTFNAGGATLSTGSLVVGVASNGFGLLTGSSGAPLSQTIRVADQCTIGHFGTGEIRAGIGGLDCGTLMLGQNQGSSGTLGSTGPVAVHGSATIGFFGSGTLDLSSTLRTAGGVTMGFGPGDADVTLDGGSIIAGSDVAIGLSDGQASLTLRGGASIESTQRISMNGATYSAPIAVALPAIPSSMPCFAAPTMTGVRCALSIDPAAVSGTTWHIARVFSGALPICTINSNPASGLQLKLISCAQDLYLALFPIGEPDPTPCIDAVTAVVVEASSADPARLFGSGGIAVGNGWFCVGSPGIDGGVDIFRGVNGHWTHETTLLSPEKGWTLGSAVAVSGDRLVTRTTDGARAFTFVRADGQWTLEQAFEIDAGAAGIMPRSLALDGNTLAIATPFSDIGSVVDAGAVSIFRFAGGAWALDAVIPAEVPTTNQRFGGSLSISNNRCAIGAASNATISILASNGSSWVPEGFVTSSMNGADIAMKGTDLVTGSTARFWRGDDVGWNLAGSGGVGASTTAPLGKVSFDGSTAAFLGSTTLSTYRLAADGSWHMGESLPLPSGSSESLLAVAVGGPLICVARDASVLVYGTLPPSSCPADFNGDGDVAGSDLSFILSSWGNSPFGDLSGDGITDGVDLATVLVAWGPCQ